MRPYRFFEIAGGAWGCWWRVFGYGLSVRRAALSPLAFSERSGSQRSRTWSVGPFIVKLLSPRSLHAALSEHYLDFCQEQRKRFEQAILRPRASELLPDGAFDVVWDPP